MGVIEIRRASEKPNTIGNVPQPHIYRDETAGLVARASGKAAESVGAGVAGLAKSLLSLGQYIAEKDTKERVDAFVARFQNGMQIYDYGAGAMSESDDPAAVVARSDLKRMGYDVDRGKGAMFDDITESAKWLEDNVAFRDKFGQRLKDEIGMSDKQFIEARQRLTGFNLSTQKQWMGRVAKYEQAKRVGGAEARMAAATRTIAAITKLGNDGVAPDEADNSRNFAVWDEWKMAMENAMDANGITDPSAKKEYMFKAGTDILQSCVKQYVADADNAVLGANDPKKVRAAWDKAISALKESNAEDAFFPKNAEFTVGGKKVNYLREAVEGMDMDRFRKAAFHDLEQAKNRSVAEAKRLDREIIFNKRGDFYQLNPEIARMASPEQQIAAYEDIAEQYRDSDPQFFNMIMGKALVVKDNSDLRKARAERAAASAKRALDKAEANLRKNDLIAMAIDLSIPPTAEMSEQERRDYMDSRMAFDQLYLEAFRRREISGETAKTIMGIMDRVYTAEDERALALFDESFGFDRGRFPTAKSVNAELNKNPATEIEGITAKRSWYLPDKTMNYQQFQTYREEFLLQMRRAPKGIDREEYARKTAENIKAKFVADHAADILSGMRTEFELEDARGKAKQKEERERIERMYRVREAETIKAAPRRLEASSYSLGEPVGEPMSLVGEDEDEMMEED